MFRRILVKELLKHMLDMRVGVYTAVCVLLVTGSFLLQVREYRARDDDSRRMEKAFTDHVWDMTWRDMWHFQRLFQEGYQHVSRPSPLMAFCRGTELYEPEFSAVSFKTWDRSQVPAWRTQKYRNQLEDLFLHLDFTVIVTFVLSLLVLVFAYDAVSGEREEGTMRLVLSNAVSRGTVLAAKLCAGYLVILVPLLMSLLICLLIVQVLPGYNLNMTETGAAMAVFLLASLYLLVLYCCGIFISTLSRRSSMNIALLLMIWLVFIVGIHNVTILVFRNIVRPVSIGQLMQNLQMKSEDAWRARMKERAAKYPQGTGGLPVAEQITLVENDLGSTKRLLDSYLDDYTGETDRFYRTQQRVSFLSPSLLFTVAATDIAGTGVSGYLHRTRELKNGLSHFMRAGLAEMRKDLLFPDVKNPYGRYTVGEKRPPVILSEFEQYRPRPQPLIRRFSSAMETVLALCLYAVLLVLLSFLTFMRKDVV